MVSEHPIGVRSETAEDVRFRVQNHCQSVYVTVASAVKFLSFETIAIAPPQKRKPLSSESWEDLQKG
jgi:hypothetical protein